MSYLGKTGKSPPSNVPLPPAHLLSAETFSMLFRTFPSTILPIFKSTRFFFFYFCYFDWTNFRNVCVKRGHSPFLSVLLQQRVRSSVPLPIKCTLFSFLHIPSFNDYNPNRNVSHYYILKKFREHHVEFIIYDGNSLLFNAENYFC